MGSEENLEGLQGRVHELIYGDAIHAMPKRVWMGAIVQAASRVIERMKAMGLDPRSYYDHRASFLCDLGRHAEAIPDFVAMHDPEYHNRILLRRLAVACRAAGQYENALEAINASIATGEAGAAEKEVRGKVLRALGRDSEAEEDEAAVKAYYETEARKWNDPNHYYSHK